MEALEDTWRNLQKIIKVSKSPRAYDVTSLTAEFILIIEVAQRVKSCIAFFKEILGPCATIIQNNL